MNHLRKYDMPHVRPECPRGSDQSERHLQRAYRPAREEGNRQNESELLTQINPLLAIYDYPFLIQIYSL